MFIYDRLYKRVPYTFDDWRLFQTPEFVRLHDISLSAVPPRFIPTGMAASRFEHSIGVAHLARLFGQKIEPDMARNLYFAALAHDIGSPPFSHVGEHFQRRLVQKNHEEFLANIILESEFGREVQKQGGCVKTIIALINRKVPVWSDLINGSIDLDNLDNTLRYGISMGILHDYPYFPEKLAQGFMIRDGSLYIEHVMLDQLHVWAKCRERVYSYVMSPQNASPRAMLYRAMYLAYKQKELDRSFVTFTDSHALDYLRTKCNSRTQRLIERAMHWQNYVHAFNFLTQQASPQFAAFIESIDTRDRLADGLCERYGLPLEDVTVYTGRHRGFRHIHVPLWNGTTMEFIPKTKEPTWQVEVLINPCHKSWEKDIKKYVIQELQNVA